MSKKESDGLIERMSNPKSIEDVLMQCGAYGLGDSKYIASAIRTYLLSVLPASNRKSCNRSEHYMSRYKEGWNACLKSVKERWGIG
jgi:hypothetical protein